MLGPKAELAQDHAEQFDPLRSKNDGYDAWGPWNFGARARNNTWGEEDEHGDDGGVQLRPLNTEDDDRSGVHSPPFWTTSPVHPRQHLGLSPTSRIQAIARGQRELMEMVKNMAESSYELSLKDLVENPRAESQEECLLQEKNYNDLEEVVGHQRVNIKRQETKWSEKKSNITRSASMDDRGLFIKIMGFPISFRKKKKKNHVINSTNCAKVSPKPDQQVSDRTSRSVDRDWWKKRFSFSSGSDSSGSRGSSGSNGNRSSSSIRKLRSGFFNGFFPCLHLIKGKSTKEQEGRVPF